jgi:hypothetical protein
LYSVKMTLHTVEVVGSNPAAPTIINSLATIHSDPGPMRGH